MDSRRRLRSWKQIAAFFSADTRTVKRWETLRGLPVHRPAGVRAAVFAYEDELEQWMLGNDLYTLPEPPQADDRDAEPVFPHQEGETPSTTLKPSRPGGGKGEEEAAPPGRAPWVLACRKRARTMLGFLLRPLPVSALAVLLIATSAVLLQYGDLYGAAPGNGLSMIAPSLGLQKPKPEARNSYLIGLYQLRQETRQALQSAAGDFLDALLLDPTYVPAYVGLAQAYDRMGRYEEIKPSIAFRRGREAAERALRLAPASPGAKAALALSILFADHDLDRAESLLRSAIATNPNTAEAQHVLALALMYRKTPKEALGAIEAAQRLAPASHAILADMAEIEFHLGQSGKAAALLRQVETAAPDFVLPHVFMTTILLSQHHYRAFLEEYRILAALTENPARRTIAATAGAALSMDDRKAFLKALFEAQQKALAEKQISAYEVARTAALMGERSKCRRYLQMARKRGGIEAMTIASNPLFAFLRTDAGRLAANLVPAGSPGARSLASPR